MSREQPESRAHHGDMISRNTILAFASQVSTAFFRAVLTFYLVRALGVAAFGVFSLAISITGLLLGLSELGTTQSAARFVAERLGDTKGIAGVLGMARRTRLLTASGIALPLFNTGPSPVTRRQFMSSSGAMFVVGGASAAFSAARC